MLKILTYIVSLLFGKRLISVSYEVIVDYAIARVRSMAKSAAMGFAGIVLLITGALVAFFNVLSTYDEKSVLLFSAVAGGGLSISGLGFLLILIASYRKSHTDHIAHPSEVFGAQAHSPLEEAMANLINDFVANRREKHAEKQAASGAL